MLYLMDITYLCLQFCLWPGATKDYVNDFWTTLKSSIFSFTWVNFQQIFKLPCPPLPDMCAFPSPRGPFSPKDYFKKKSISMGFFYCNFESSLLDMENKLYSIFIISCKSLNTRSQELGDLGPSEDHSWIAADGTQGVSAARAPFTDPEQHAGAASKLKNTPVNLLKNLHHAKRKFLVYFFKVLQQSYHIFLNSVHPVHPLHETLHTFLEWMYHLPVCKSTLLLTFHTQGIRLEIIIWHQLCDKLP